MRYVAGPLGRILPIGDADGDDGVYFASAMEAIVKFLDYDCVLIDEVLLNGGFIKGTTYSRDGSRPAHVDLTK